MGVETWSHHGQPAWQLSQSRFPQLENGLTTITLNLQAGFED